MFDKFVEKLIDYEELKHKYINIGLPVKLF